MEMSRRFFHSNSLRGVANYASERRKRVIPSAGEGPHLLAWIINLYLSIQHRTREVPRSEPDWRCLHGSG